MEENMFLIYLCQPITGLAGFCKPMLGFIFLTCKLFLGRDKQ